MDLKRLQSLSSQTFLSASQSAQASNNAWKEHIVWMVFGSKMLLSFLMSAIYSSQVSTLQTDADKQW